MNFSEEDLDDMANACVDRIDDGQRTARQVGIMAYKKAVEQVAAGFACSDTQDCVTPTGRNSIWHDVSEYPSVRGVNIFAMQGGKCAGVLYFEYKSKEDFDITVKQHNIVKWAYKYDLIDA